ncbi:SGNH/GDSL hydrolase family protein [Microbacterium dauci]|uniref:SGNH/GDSL hydrolase family protein n=1 Tax=Microbacterium dauci TaxID=3048008 RepID=A0ABT6ZGQ6_9MICO|nr:SGNH/GDSL hydrolase family protein [Microbacterium sp. LX3-4]MDJ1115343.1 SGNH/GDSL hydrolase family protein [Microbacterium sp. LX3-4]
MTLVRLRGLADDLPAPSAATVTVTLQRWARHAPATVIDGADVVFARPVTIRDLADISVPPTDGRYCIRWTIDPHIAGVAPLYRYTSIPAGAAIDFKNLPDVDPETFDTRPGSDAIAAWEAALAELRLVAESLAPVASKVAALEELTGEGRLSAPELSRTIVDEVETATVGLARGQANGLTSVMARGAADAVLAVLGDSTGNETTEWVYRLVVWLGQQFPAYTIRYYLWDDATQGYGALATIQTGTGTRTLTVYNGSHPGAGYDYPITSVARFNAMIPVEPTTVINSFGYNSTSATYRIQVLELARWIMNKFPSAEYVWAAQPPISPGETGAANHLARVADVRAVASAEGFGLIDATQAFIDYGDYSALLASDNFHPNAAGSAVWFEAAKRYFKRAADPTPRGTPARQDRIFVPGYTFIPSTGSPTVGVTGLSFPYMALDPTTPEGVVALVDIPPTWKSANVWVLWNKAADGTAGDALVFRLDHGRVTSSMNANASGTVPAGLTTGDYQTVTILTTNAVRATRMYTAERFADGRPRAFRLYRNAGTAADTYPGDMMFLGLLIERAE